MAIPGFLLRRPWLMNVQPIDLGARPVEVEHKAHPAAAIFLILFSLVWLAISLSALWPVLSGGRMPWPMLIFVTVFPAVGLVSLAGGIAQLVSRRSIRFGPDGVDVDETGPLGRRRWHEPYTAFAGVRLAERRQRRNKRSTVIWQVLELVHPDESKTLLLSARRGTAPPRGEWEAAARALDLPALGEDGSARRPEELDLSLRERAEQGEAVTAWSPDTAVPAGVTVVQETGPDGPQLVVTLLRPRLPVWLPGLVAAIAIAIGLLSLFDGRNPLLGLAIGLVVAVGAGWLGAVDRGRRRRLIVTRQRIRLEEPLSWLVRGEEAGALSHADVEDVRLTGPRRHAVAIEGDRGRLVTGRGLKQKELTWLRDFVAAAIVKA